MAGGFLENGPMRGRGRLDRGLVVIAIVVVCASAGYSATRSLEGGELKADDAPKPQSEIREGKLEPVSARDFYNEGARRLGQTNLWRAEYNFERAVAFQDERMQPTALYNLGHVRFSQGAEELKKSPSARKTTRMGKAAVNEADDAIHAVDDALGNGSAAADPGTASAGPPGNADTDETITRLVNSYLKGRGARRDLRAAVKAVKLALQAHQSTLLKWERSSGDFKSAIELNARDADARHNAEVVDRSIAKLVDQIKQLKEMAMALGQKEQQLGDKLKKCRGRIPAPNMPPGAAGDDEEDDKVPFGKEPGQEEAGGKEEMREIGLTAEQAAWLLDAFKLDTDRRLPMTEGKQGKPNDRSRPTW